MMRLWPNPDQQYCEVQLLKTFFFSESHPYSFVQHIQPALRFICSLCFTEEGKGLLFQRFTIFCFNLLKGILLCMEYRPAKNLEDTKVTKSCQIGSLLDTVIAHSCGTGDGLKCWIRLMGLAGNLTNLSTYECHWTFLSCRYYLIK